MVISAAIALALSSDDTSPPTPTTSTPSAEAPETHVLAAEPSTTVAEPAPVPEDPAPVVLAPPPDLHSADGMTRVLDETRKRFGDTMGYELAIMENEALLARPDPTDDGSKLIYSYVRGWGDPSTRPRSDTDDLTDLGAFDVQAAAAALAAAPETLHIAPGRRVGNLHRHRPHRRATGAGSAGTVGEGHHDLRRERLRLPRRRKQHQARRVPRLSPTIIDVATRQTPGTRAKDSDRNDTCQVLDSALAEGQLSMEEHRQRVASATNAATLGELRSLVSDLQNANAPVQLPTLKSRPRLPAGGGWGLRIATAAVLVLLGMGIGWGLYGNTASPLSFETDPGAKSDGIPAKVLTPPKQLQSLGGLNGLFEQMRQKFGDTSGFEMNIRPDRATLYRPDTEDPRRKLMYDYRGGWGDPYSTTTVDADDRVVDLSKFNVEQTIAILRGAPESLGIQRRDISDTWIDIEPSKDPATPDAVNLRLYVSSEFGSGFIDLAPDGAIKQVNKPS